MSMSRRRLEKKSASSFQKYNLHGQQFAQVNEQLSYMSICESDKSTLRTAPLLSRHSSFLTKRKPTQLDSWLDEQHSRSLSVPDLHKLSREWELYQRSDATAENRIIDTKMQVSM